MNRRQLLFQHFSETALLLALEVVLAVGLNAVTLVVKLPEGLIDWTDRTLKWSCLVTLLVFAIESLAIQILWSAHEILNVASKLSKRAERVSKAGG